MPESSGKLYFLTCSHCRGKGIVNAQKCKVCRGKGQVGYLDGNVLFWGEEINSRSLILNKAERLIAKAIYIILFIFGLSGILSLLVAFYFSGWQETFGLLFSPVKNLFLAYFWLTILFDLALVYYYFLSLEIKEKVMARKYISFKDKEIVAPLLDWRSLHKINNIDIAKSFNEEAFLVIEKAHEIAEKYQAAEILPVHFFISTLLYSGEVEDILLNLAVDLGELAKKLKFADLDYNSGQKQDIFSQTSKSFLIRSYRFAYLNRAKEVSAIEIMYEAIKADKMIQQTFEEINISLERLEAAVLRYYAEKSREKKNLKRGSDFASAKLQTPFLNHFSSDLAKMPNHNPYITRDILAEFEGKAGSFILIDEADDLSGIIYDLAEKIRGNNAPEILAGKRLVNLDMQNLLAGASLTEATKRFYHCLNEIIRAKNIILFIDDAHELLPELVEILNEALSSGSFTFIGATDLNNYENIIKSSSLGNLLNPIVIKRQ